MTDHVFMAGPSAVASNVEIGAYTFIGVNATVREGIRIEEKCFIGAGALIMRHTKPSQVYAQERTRPAKQDIYQLFNLSK